MAKSPDGASGVQHLAVADDESGLRLDRWFRRRFPGLGHAHLEKLLRSGQVRLDGRRCRAKDRVEPGQSVRVPPLPARDAARSRPKTPAAVSDAEARALARRVLWRDADVVVLDKPPGLAVQGGSGTRRHLDAMLDALRFGGERPRLVHRLDKDTSGVLVLARSASAAAALGRSFKSKAAEKLYWALVVGLPKPAEGRIDLALAKMPGRAGERVVADPERGLRAVTEYAVIERAGRRAAWLALEPVTGRTHQLRVHCAALGTPVVGDGKYGGRAAFIDGLAPAVHLHARRIAIPHPRGGVLVAEAPLPEHMAATWRFLGFDEPRPAPAKTAPVACA